MEAVLQGVGRKEPPAVGTMVVNDNSFTVFSVSEGGDSLKAYVNPPEYIPFAEGLLRAGMEFLRLARERVGKEASECPTTAPPS